MAFIHSVRKSPKPDVRVTCSCRREDTARPALPPLEETGVDVAPPAYTPPPPSGRSRSNRMGTAVKSSSGNYSYLIILLRFVTSAPARGSVQQVRDVGKAPQVILTGVGPDRANKTLSQTGSVHFVQEAAKFNQYVCHLPESNAVSTDDVSEKRTAFIHRVEEWANRSFAALLSVKAARSSPP